jgi:YD repeat-containing protein
MSIRACIASIEIETDRSSKRQDSMDLKRKYQRNAGGQVSQTTTPDGRKVSYSYDLLGNVSIVNYDDGTKEVYTYDKSGLLIEAVNENGIVSLERDEIGRVLAETQNGVRIENEYNRLGQRISLKSSLGADIKISETSSETSSTRV